MKKNIPTSGPTGHITMHPEKVKLNYQEGKPEKYRLHWERAGTITAENITKYAAQTSMVPESAIIMAQEALFDAIDYFCANGHSVQVPYLGTFSLQLDGSVVDTPKEADALSVKRRRLRFYPKARLRAACRLENISIEVIDRLGLKKKKNG